VALPLIGETSKKVNYLYDLQDAGYDADIIRDFSKQHGHCPIIGWKPTKGLFSLCVLKAA